MILTKDPTSGRYILKVDASIYKEMDCARYIMLKLIYGFQQPSAGKNPVMEYGTAGHKFLQARYEGKPFDEQLQLATTHFSQPEIVVSETDWRNMGHLVGTLVGYDTFYKQNGELLKVSKCEHRFTLPFFKTDLVEVLLCGTVDLIGTWQGQPVIVDHKFTSAWNQYEYLAEYDLSPQLMIYKSVVDRLYGVSHGCMVNGIFISAKAPAKFKRSDPIQFSEEQITGLLADFKMKVMTIVSGLEDMIRNPGASDSTKTFKPNYCACIKRYGEKASPCNYTMLCKQPSFAESVAMAESCFEMKEYDPTTHQL